MKSFAKPFDIFISPRFLPSQMTRGRGGREGVLVLLLLGFILCAALVDSAHGLVRGDLVKTSTRARYGKVRSYHTTCDKIFLALTRTKRPEFTCMWWNARRQKKKVETPWTGLTSKYSPRFRYDRAAHLPNPEQIMQQDFFKLYAAIKYKFQDK